MKAMKLKIGDRVKVINPKCKTCGCLGTVSTTYNNYGSLYVKGCYVTLDSGHYLYFNGESLTKISEKEKEENNTMIVTGDFNVVKVKFLSGTNTNVEYEYASFEPDLAVGDTVVVSSAHHGLGLAKVSALVDRDKAATQKFEREIVCKVDMEPYNIRREKRIKAMDLNNRMNQRVQELNKLAIFEMMAEKDESLRDMLNEYKELIG